jgi:hypothetical protein
MVRCGGRKAECYQDAPDTSCKPRAMPEGPERECNQAATGNDQRNYSVGSQLAHRTGQVGQQVHRSKQHRSSFVCIRRPESLNTSSGLNAT